MLIPKQTKHTKQFKGLIKGKTYRGNKIIFGKYALKTVEETRIPVHQIESARRIISKKMKRLGYLWIRRLPDTPVSKKPNEIRMGKGKGAINDWVAKIKKGQILYEINGVSLEIAKKALLSGSKKLSIKTKFIQRGL